MECSVPGCDLPARTRGWCNAHYWRWTKHGDVQADKPLRTGFGRRPNLPCSVPGCAQPRAGHGFCRARLRRLETHDDVRADAPVQVYTRGRKGGLCAVEGCDRAVRAREWCTVHYQRWQAYGDPLGGGTFRSPVPLPRREKPSATARSTACAIADCQRPRRCREWCSAHYMRWRTYGDPLGGGPVRAVRGTGPTKWEKDQIRRAAKAKICQVSGETADYVAIIKGDPCSYCGAPMEHVDHIVPFSAGGPTDWENLAPACARCNHRKSSKSLVFFLLERAEGGDEDVGRAPYQAA
jgi:HNH endonuclease